MDCPYADVADVVAFCDPAGGKQKLAKQRAESAIVTIGRVPTGHVIVLECFLESCPTDTLTERIFATHARWRPNPFGIEKCAMQSLYVDAIEREARQRNVRLNLLGVEQPKTVDKDWRIRTALQPLIAAGKLLLGADMAKLREQIATFGPHNPGGRKDGIDALASAVRLLPIRGTDGQRADDQRALAAYLRESGMPEALIQKRLREIARGGRDYPKHAAVW